MTSTSRITTRLAGAVAALAIFGAGAAKASYVQVNLVSNLNTLGAAIVDPNLKNPWGVSFRASTPASPFWVSDQGTTLSTLYAVTGATTVSKVPLEVGMPKTAGGPQGPTGQVSSTSTTAFPVSVASGGNGAAARFIFASLNGTISAWNNPAGPAFIQATTPNAVYTGLAINSGQTRLYAANGAGNRIDVFDSAFNPVSLPGGFVDPNLSLGFVPFNVEQIGGKIYVTYAPAGLTAQRNAGLGQGTVAVFDENGAFQGELISGSQLAAPWGLALAPAGFGAFGGDLLVGNFSFLHSEINAFDPVTGAFEGSIPVNTGSASPGGLWDLTFGGGGSAGDPNTLYFTDGINGEVDGLFAAVASVPEPATFGLVLGGLTLLGLRSIPRRRHRSSPAA